MILRRAEALQRFPHPGDGFALGIEHGLGVCRLFVARQEPEIFAPRLNDLVLDVGRFACAGIHREQGVNAGTRWQVQSTRGLSLRIEVQEQDAFTSLCQAVRQADSGGGLAHPAFLVGDRNDGCHGNFLIDFEVITFTVGWIRKRNQGIWKKAGPIKTKKAQGRLRPVGCVTQPVNRQEITCSIVIPTATSYPLQSPTTLPYNIHPSTLGKETHMITFIRDENLETEPTCQIATLFSLLDSSLITPLEIEHDPAENQVDPLGDR